MTAVGFEPTPLRTGTLSQRLRPFGQTVDAMALIVQNVAMVLTHALAESHIEPAH